MAYITISEVRAAGVPTSFTDEQITDKINLWQSFIERYCRQWFESRDKTLYMYGTGYEFLWLPLPAISVSGLYINESATPVDSSLYEIASDMDFMIDRYDPRIILKSGDLFLEDYKQKIVGAFGFVDVGPVTPPAIKDALLKLIILDFKKGTNLWDEMSRYRAGKVRSEMTDGHLITYMDDPSGSAIIPGEVKEILDMYRAPLLIGATGTEKADTYFSEM